MSFAHSLVCAEHAFCTTHNACFGMLGYGGGGVHGRPAACGSGAVSDRVVGRLWTNGRALRTAHRWTLFGTAMGADDDVTEELVLPTLLLCSPAPLQRGEGSIHIHNGGA